MVCKIKKVILRLAGGIQTIVGNCKNKEDYLKSNWIYRSYYFYRFVNKLFHKYALRYYLRNLSLKLKKEIASNSEFEKRIKLSFKNVFIQSSDEIKMFISKIIFLSGMLDEDICKMIMDFANTTQNSAYRYWTALDISFATFQTQKGLYDEFYCERRELLKKIALELEIESYIRTDITKNDVNRLCIIVYHLEPEVKNSLFRVLKMAIDGLKRYYDEIVVLTTDSFYRDKTDVKLTTVTVRMEEIYSKDFAKKISKILGDKVRVEYVEKGDYKSRFKDFIQKLYQINPREIIDFSDEFSPLSYYYSKDFPTFYIPLRVGVSSSFYTYLIGLKWRICRLNQKYKCVDENKIREWSFPEYIPCKEGNYDRKKIGINSNSFVIATTGLCSEVAKDEFSEEIGNLLKNNPQMVWVIISGKAPLLLHERYKELFNNNQIIERDYENNLYAFYKICDVLLRMDTTGGSNATAIAAMAGLPIVMTNYVCDPMRWLGYEYSNISTYSGLCNELMRLYNDRSYYNKKRNECKELVDKATNYGLKWHELYNILKER